MTNKLKESIRFHYLLTEILLCTINSIGIEYIPNEVLSKIKDKSITHNIFRIYDDDSIICEFYGIMIRLQEKPC